MSWQCRCRLDQVDQKLLSLMRRAGCRMLLYGVESGSEETLQVMNKRLRRGVAREAIERVKWTVEAGIFPSLSMVVGIPEETLNGLNATMVLAAEFVKLGTVNAFIQLMSPLPGTALAKRVSHRLEYRGEDAPTAFSQGIEFVDNRRLPEDEELIRAWPQIFQSFYTVAPDHGDLDICIDVSLAYCKLLEVYCYTFLGLAEHLGVSLLDLFRQLRDELSAKRPGRRGLNGVKDFEIWDGFAQFAIQLFRETNAPDPLQETFRYEQLVHTISVSPPVQTDMENGTVTWPHTKPFRLCQAAHVFRTKYVLPPIADRSSKNPSDTLQSLEEMESEQALLIFMTRDRLEVVKLQPELAQALELLEYLNLREYDDSSYYLRLSKVLRPLSHFGIFELIDPSQRATQNVVSTVKEGIR